jgi:hypothetical protein
MRAITATFLLALPLLPVHAQQQNTITLACNGTSKLTATAAANIQPDPITKLGIIVNVADRTVTFMDYVMPVTGINATLVRFEGRQQQTFEGQLFGKPFSILGLIDRVTGYTEIDWLYEVAGDNHHWELSCRPATRLF